MPPIAAPRPPGFSRRTLLAASATGLALLSAGCTASPAEEGQDVTSAQADGLGAQVAVQEALVGAFTAAGTTDPALAPTLTELAAQAVQQLDRLRAAAPGVSASPAPSAAPPDGPGARAWLRAQIAAAATSHAAACLEQSGGRAALLGSIAAGLRGQDGRLA